MKYGLVKGETFFTDSTHKKANANKNKHHIEIVQEVKRRREWLEKEINEERVKQGKKEFEYTDEIEEKEIKVSETDKESGYYHRDNKEKGFIPKSCGFQLICWCITFGLCFAIGLIVCVTNIDLGMILGRIVQLVILGPTLLFAFIFSSSLFPLFFPSLSTPSLSSLSLFY